ncbi:hypothetical protein BJY04DRAFT_187048 [Aspergillus karnatakaensis]|uniref:uncharacterized protein n=1 Tax=Aspergillus karnatakaensis TaxID=1810916 RepID=UPI003CCDB415
MFIPAKSGLVAFHRNIDPGAFQGGSFLVRVVSQIFFYWMISLTSFMSRFGNSRFGWASFRLLDDDLCAPPVWADPQ